MSIITLSPNAAGTGTFTIASPNSNTNRTLNLPDSAGTLATAESTLAQFNASGSAPVYACRAWVNFNGTGTVAIRASGNVTSITDNGTGDYTINFTTAMPDVNYAVVGTSGPNSGVNRLGGVTAFPFASGASFNTSSVRIGVASGGAGDPTQGSVMFDTTHAFVAIFR
jgi:hypothetical protein